MTCSCRLFVVKIESEAAIRMAFSCLEAFLLKHTLEQIPKVLPPGFTGNMFSHRVVWQSVCGTGHTGWCVLFNFLRARAPRHGF